MSKVGPFFNLHVFVIVDTKRDADGSELNVVNAFEVDKQTKANPKSFLRAKL